MKMVKNKVYCIYDYYYNEWFSAVYKGKVKADYIFEFTDIPLDKEYYFMKNGMLKEITEQELNDSVSIKLK